MTNESRPSRPLERGVHYSLFVGLSLSGVLLAAGLAANWMAPAAEAPLEAQSLGKTLEGAVRGNAAALMNLGILALMATPILRVLVLTVGWTLDAEWRMAAIAAAVLILLGISLTMGLG